MKPTHPHSPPSLLNQIPLRIPKRTVSCFVLRPPPHSSPLQFSPPQPLLKRRHVYDFSRFAPSPEAKTASYLRPQTMTSLYEILGIPAVATCQEIKSAYRRLARVCHTDVAAIELKDTSADEFMKIHAAYSTLSDPDKRADYDRQFMRRSRPLSSASGYSGYYARRNWETDQCW